MLYSWAFTGFDNTCSLLRFYRAQELYTTTIIRAGLAMDLVRFVVTTVASSDYVLSSLTPD